MRGKKIAVAVVSVFMLLSVLQFANAAPPFHGSTPDALEGYCFENGGTYFPPGVGGAYACLLPDGTLIACGGVIPICTQSFTVKGGALSIYESISLSMQTEMITKLDAISTQLTNLQSICSGGTGTIL